jgi:ABC-2 type transport system permease protein
MTALFQLFRKEWRMLWLSPLTYAAWAVFLFVAGLNMWRLLVTGAVESQGGLMFGSTFFWVGVLAVITALTIPLLAEESRSGTLESLLTAPVADTAVVLAKFAAAWLTLVVMTLPTLAYLPIASALSLGGDTVAPAALAAGMLVLAVAGAAYVALGLFVSSLTRRQALAASVTFPALCTVFFLESLLPLLRHPWARSAVAAVATAQHVVDAARGIMDTRPLVLYATVATWFLFATVKVLESRHWR